MIIDQVSVHWNRFSLLCTGWTINIWTRKGSGNKSVHPNLMHFRVDSCQDNRSLIYIICSLIFALGTPDGRVPVAMDSPLWNSFDLDKQKDLF